MFCNSNATAQMIMQGPTIRPNKCGKQALQDQIEIGHRMFAALAQENKELRKANDNLFKVARKHCVENQQLKSKALVVPITKEQAKRDRAQFPELYK